MSVDLEAMLKKRPLQILQLATKEVLSTEPRSHGRGDCDATFNVDFANVVKLSENESPEG